MPQEPISKLIERVHRRCAPVLAAMALAIVARRLSVSTLEEWVRALRDGADDLDRWARERRGDKLD